MLETWILGHGLLILSYLLAIVGIVHMLRNRRSPGATMAWLIAFVSLPFVGTVLYLTFGGRKLRTTKRLAQRRRPTTDVETPQFPATLQDTFSGYGVSPATDGNRIIICRNGVEGYHRLIGMISAAKQRIYLLTYIFNDDSIGHDIRNRLIARAREGLDVRVLADALGSVSTSPRFFEPLTEAGGRVALFHPVLRFPFRPATNLRNHRKICVIDGRSSFAGGMNVTNEDIYPTSTKDAWQDLSLGIDGPAASQLEDVFCEDWKAATGRRPDVASPHQKAVGENDVDDGQLAENESIDNTVQILASGPNVPNDPMYSTSLTGIFRASQRVWIATPYFIPNDALVEAIVFACQRGVDVRILVPAASNHPVSDLAAASLLREIQAAGGTVLRYQNGMMHGKAMIMDDEVAAVGSANLDMRSLFLNYEVMQLCYSKQTIDGVGAWFTHLAQDCTTEIPEPGLLRELSEGAVRALSPMF